MTKVEIDYDYLGVDRVTGIPTTGQLIKFRKQMVRVQASYKCNIAEAKDHKWSWIMCTLAQWILKKVITAQVPVPTNPGPYTGDTNILHAAHKQKLELYQQHEEHKGNTNKAIQSKHASMKIYSSK
mmetsp:Transcript_35343/g.39411  ORF Transcript_35343/g.39411 Transcript_35343/m.39411 type:complete len:126 (-) Transcript_35343:979-1356(-)